MASTIRRICPTFGKSFYTMSAIHPETHKRTILEPLCTSCRKRLEIYPSKNSDSYSIRHYHETKCPHSYPDIYDTPEDAFIALCGSVPEGFSIGLPWAEPDDYKRYDPRHDAIMQKYFE
jgi:hypothetical protein